MTDRKPERRGLGRGLSALMADVAPQAAEGSGPRTPDFLVPVDRLHPNPDQPRRDFAPDAMAELAASIRERGVIQPLIVRRHPSIDDAYEIVAGERRWRAAQMAQVHDIPVVVRDFTDTEVLEVAIIENIQRADLNPVEEAMAYRQLQERFGHTQEKLADGLGKSRSHIANVMRLLSLPEEVLAMVRDNRLSAGHARALITTGDPAALARQVVARGLSVRQTEALARKPATAPRAAAPRRHKDADTAALEGDLAAHLGVPVSIEHANDGSGRLSLRYRNLDELDGLCRLLTTGGSAKTS
ncbi:MAG: ParB/RepB/Spo0J family partition protein [Rhodobacteraceae bacterium]|nr:ParB/RepB/Spo0J family partition protein [Paracoccaceae bacterium]